jgi:hypothetical protein
MPLWVVCAHFETSRLALVIRGLSMTTRAPAAYGMYPTDVALRQIVETLNLSGFEKEDICMMVSTNHPFAAVVREANILGREPKSSAITAEWMGWLMKMGAVVIPNVSLFVRSPAFLDALVVSRDGPSVYSDRRALVGLGFSESDAVRFESQLREMGVLVYVSCSGRVRTTRALEVLRRTGATETAALEKEVASGAAA